MNELGICIVTRRSKEEVLACLDSVMEQSRNLDVQIVVVDNDSQDGAVDEIRLKFPGVKFILNKENLGFFVQQ